MIHRKGTELQRGVQPAHMRLRWVPFIITLALLTCSSGEKPTAEALVGDVWWGHVPQRGLYEEMAIEFTLSEDGLDGVLHFLSGGKKVSELPLRNIDFDPPDLTFRAGDFRIKCRVDLDSGRLKGKAAMEGSRGVDLSAERRDPTTIPGLLPGCADYEYRLPVEASDGWATATPEEVGLDRASLESIVRAIAEGQAGVMHSLLIAQDGRLVLEEYFHGYEADDLHAIASCTKSVTSLLIGAALDHGLIYNVETPVLDFFPTYAENAAVGWERVRLVHLLTMTAGLGWPENKVMPARGADPGFAGNGPAGFRRVLGKAVVKEPGSRWDYVNPDVNLLGGIIREASGQQADEFAVRYLFIPLGITDFDWSTYGKVEGYPNLAGSLRLRPRDLAKIGALVVSDGMWQDREVLSREWLRRSCTAQVGTGNDIYGYGFLWWVMNLPTGKRIIEARGWGSQFVFIDFGNRRVIVTTGGNDTNGRTFDITQVLVRHLYPEALGPHD